MNIRGIELMDGTKIYGAIFTDDGTGILVNIPDNPKTGDVDKVEDKYYYHAIKRLFLKK